MALILVVDDKEPARFTLREILGEAGHEVVEAGDGKAALEQQRAHSIDLVVTDIIMPEQEDVETIIELKRDYPGLKIVAISGGGTR